MRRLLPALVLAALLAAPAGASAATTLLRLDGIGPLKLGMSRSAAVATGWIGHRGKGCPLGGTPVPITYTFTGAKAPSGLRGVVEFKGDKLEDLSVSRGARTAAGVTVGSTTLSRMASRYRALDFSASSMFASTFGGTFLRVTKGGKDVIGAFGEKRTVTLLALPAVTTCD